TEIPIPGVPPLIGADLFGMEQKLQVTRSQGKRNGNFNILLLEVKIRSRWKIFSHSRGHSLKDRGFSYAVLAYQDQSRFDIPKDHIFYRFKGLYLKKRNFHEQPPAFLVLSSS